ncbi:MAG: Uma2 family endonuclease [Actinomycetota bacterium]|nr:Uma2 family endonuclease [Actinomycetota bacterium]
MELIGGEIVDTAPIGTRRLAWVVAVNHLLVASGRGRYFVSVQNPISLGDEDDPQPDLSLLRSRPDPAAPRAPGPADLLLVIEVSGTTLAHGRRVKLPLYARAGIPEVGIVDLQNGFVEVYAGPSSGDYAGVRRYGRQDELRSETVPDLGLPVADILG